MPCLAEHARYILDSKNMGIFIHVLYKYVARPEPGNWLEND